MDELPKSEFQPDVAEVIKHYQVPIASERKQALMKKLAAQKENFIQAQQDREQVQDRQQDRGGRKR